MGKTEINWIHKSFDNSDVENILKLREEIFQEPEYDYSKWEWQYSKNINGPSYIDLAVNKNNPSELAGHYAVIGYNLCFNEKKITSTQSLDTFTDPNYRRQGIFVELAEKTYENALSSNAEYVFGFPNKASYPGFVKKLNFKNPFGFNIFKFPLRSGYYLSRLPGGKLLGNFPLNFKRAPTDFVFEQVDILPDGIDELCRKSNSISAFKIYKSKDYMDWRYVNCPDRKYSFLLMKNGSSIIGILVVNEDEKNNFVHLVDFICEKKDEFNPLISKAIELYTKKKYYCMTVFTNESSQLGSVLQKIGFSCTDKSSDYRFIIRRLADDNFPDHIMNPDNWLIVGGDTDFY